MKSQWQKYISQPGNIRVVAVEATEVARELCAQQKLEGLAKLGFSEAITGALLISSAHKSNEAINLNAQGSALYKQALIDASPEGRVRGFMREEPDTSKHTFGTAGVNGAWGSGLLSILYTKNFEGKTPYTGMVPISSGHLDDAINEYYRDSEQLVSMVGLNVDFDGKEIRSAKGVLVQALGGADADELADIQSLQLKDLRALAATIDGTETFIAKASSLLKDRNFKVVETTPLSSFCTCSQERIERALLLTGEEDTLEALADDPVMTVTCDFCRTEYKLMAERVRGLFKRDPSRLQ